MSQFFSITGGLPRGWTLGGKGFRKALGSIGIHRGPDTWTACISTRMEIGTSTAQDARMGSLELPWQIEDL